MNPSKGTTVNLVCNGFAPTDAKIEWLLNDAVEENSIPNQFVLTQAKKGDTLRARARIHDQDILSNTIMVGNTPPELASADLIIAPHDSVNAFKVAAVGTDADGDNVTLQYEWTVNGNAAGTKDTLEKPVKRGDVVTVKVTPYDGESYGPSAEFSRTIDNFPPIIQEHNDFQFDGSLYQYQVKASDPDEDTLTYSVESAPEGMTIGSSSGLLTWNVPSEFKGVKSVPVVVNDGHDGTARYVLNITIQ